MSKDPGWVKKVIEQVPRVIHTRRIRKGFDELFSRSDAESNQPVMRSHPMARSDSARSLDVAEFCADASNHWDDLHPQLQKDIEEALGHAEIDGGHIIGVMDDNAGTQEDEP